MTGRALTNIKRPAEPWRQRLIRSLLYGRNVDRARWVVAWWLVEATHLSQRAVAEALHMNQSTMSRAVMRIRGLRVTEPQVGAWMDALDREPGARRG